MVTKLGNTVTVDNTPSTQFATLANPGTESFLPVSLRSWPPGPGQTAP